MTKEWSKQVFSKNLRKYMEQAGKTQKEVADVVGVAAPTFNEWLSGKKFPRIDKIQKLADYFGILKSDLIEEKMTEEKEKDNELLAEIIVRMRMDEEFKSLVESLYLLDSDKIQGVKQLLQAFAK
jgi:transcriptional regulator with XRE-family HTH domain